jgi:tetratricopeptide (TPR) repeat protein
MASFTGWRYLHRFDYALRRIAVRRGIRMQGSARIDELKQKFHENPRRYFAPLANEYRKAGDPEQAIAICRAHLAQQPGHMSGHVVYGQALYDAKRTDEARTVLEKALSLDPENAVVLRYLGDIARQSGKSDEARHWYSKALDVDPQDTEVAAYLAELTEPLITSYTSANEPAASEETAMEPAAAKSTSEEEELEPARELAAVEAEAPVTGEPSTIEEREAKLTEEESREAPVPVPDVEPTTPWDTDREVPLEVSDAGDYVTDVTLGGGETDDVSRTPTYTPQSPFVTRTMAELYAQQGHRAAAIEIYRQLAESDPDNQELHARLAELSARRTPTSESPAVSAHFTEAELGDGDTWDTDVWGAGFSAEDSGAAEALAEPDVQSAPAPPEAEVEQPISEERADAPSSAVEWTPAETAAEAETVGEATADEDYIAAVAAEESSEPEESAVEETRDEAALIEAAPSEAVVEAAPEEAVVEAAPEETVVGAAPEEAVVEAAPEEAVVEAAPAQAFAEAAPAEVSPVEQPRAEEPSPEEAQPEHAYAEISEDSDIVAYAPPVPEEPVAEAAPAEARTEPASARQTRTVREFFATLGARKPPEIPDRTTPEIAEEKPATPQAPSPPTPPEVQREVNKYPLADDAFASLFAGAPVAPEDSRAAAALSAAVAHPPRKTPSPTVPRPAITTAPAEVTETEEDIKRFREWLDGLTES